MFRQPLVLVSLVVFLTWVDAQKQYKGLALEAFNPCPGGELYMERLIGRPTQDENYWNGTFYLDKYQNAPEVRITVGLDHPARVTMDKKVGRVYGDVNNTFFISTFTVPPELKKVKFVVQGEEGRPFANVVSLKLNGDELCPNPAKWTPALLSVADIKEVAPDRVPTRKGPNCGYRQTQHRELILDGFTSNPGDWPWHAALYRYSTADLTSRNYACGGTLVSATFVITAAHCVQDSGHKILADRLLVGLGKFHIGGTSDAGSLEVAVFEIEIHPKYNITSAAHDIALLRLALNVEYTNAIQPVCLWEGVIEGQNIAGQKGTVVGWGRWGYEKDESIANTLQQAYMPVASSLQCLESNRGFFSNYLSDGNYCAGFRNGTSVCNGDSGGGMVFPLAGRALGEPPQWYLRGIVSLAVPYDSETAICDPENYVLFTDVAKYMPWVREIIGSA